MSGSFFMGTLQQRLSSTMHRFSAQAVRFPSDRAKDAIESALLLRKAKSDWAKKAHPGLALVDEQSVAAVN